MSIDCARRKHALRVGRRSTLTPTNLGEQVQVLQDAGWADGLGAGCDQLLRLQGAGRVVRMLLAVQVHAGACSECTCPLLAAHPTALVAGPSAQRLNSLCGQALSSNGDDHMSLQCSRAVLRGRAAQNWGRSPFMQEQVMDLLSGLCLSMHRVAVCAHWEKRSWQV